MLKRILVLIGLYPYNRFMQEELAKKYADFQNSFLSAVRATGSLIQASDIIRQQLEAIAKTNDDSANKILEELKNINAGIDKSLENMDKILDNYKDIFNRLANPSSK